MHAAVQHIGKCTFVSNNRGCARGTFMESPQAEGWQRADPWEVATCFDKASPAARALRLLYGIQESSKSVGNQYSDRNRDMLRELQLRHAVQKTSCVPINGRSILHRMPPDDNK